MYLCIYYDLRILGVCFVSKDRLTTGRMTVHAKIIMGLRIHNDHWRLKWSSVVSYGINLIQWD